MLKLRVAKANGDYSFIQDAINAVPYNTKAEIIIEEGVYEEKLFCDKADLMIRGEGKVIITYSDAAKAIADDGKKRGTFRSYTAFFSGERLTLENITIANTAGEGKLVGQAIALYLDVDNAYLKNVVLESDQDTLFLAPLPDEERENNGFYGPRVFSPRKLNKVVYEGGSIKGGVDFIFGGADALFHNVNIISSNPGYVSAPSGKKENIGFVFQKCTFTSLSLPSESVFLMRPWRDEGKCAFISCSFGLHIDRRGFSPWRGREKQSHLATFALYDSAFEGEVKIENCHFLKEDEARKILAYF